MGLMERQDLVWKVLDGVLTKDEQLAISMIVTLTPEESRTRNAA